MTSDWADLDDVVEILRRVDPRTDLRGLDDAGLIGLLGSAGLLDHAAPPTPGQLETLRALWHWSP